MGRKLLLAIAGTVVFTSGTAVAAAQAAGTATDLARRDRPRGSRARHAIMATCLLIAFGAAPHVAKADLAPFATANATCNGFNTAVSFPAVSSGHGDVVYALSSTGGSGEDNSDFVSGSNGGGFFPQFQPGDTVWGESQPVQAGTAPTLTNFECTGGTISVGLYDRPTPPFTMSGVSTGSGTVSDLSFKVLNAGQYVVDASRNQGAIDLNEDVSGFASGCFSDSSPCETIAGSGEYTLGALASGSYDLPVDGLAGPAASWALTVRELPVQLSGLAFASPYIQPATADTASFLISGTTRVAGQIDNGAGQAVDDLGSFTASYTPGGPNPGQSGITWDGRGNGGATLPDGTYTLVLTSTDPNGNTAMTQTPVLLDGTPPAVAMTSPATISPSQSVSFAVADAGSGVATISVAIDGQDVADYGTYDDSLPANGTLTISPDQTYAQSPWSLGAHYWAIVATDHAGNQANVSGSFFVGISPPSPGSGGAAKPSSGVIGGRGRVTLSGRVGRLQLDHSTQADVITFAGQPGAAATGSFDTGSLGYANFFAMGYSCQDTESASTIGIDNSDYCSTVFYINRKTKRLTAFYTSSRHYSIDGASPGMSTRQAQRRIHQIPTGGCEDGFGLGNRGTHASFVGAVVGGHAAERTVHGRTIEELFGGRMASISLESNRHPVGLLFC
jgi:hypothetical protein